MLQEKKRFQYASMFIATVCLVLAGCSSDDSNDVLTPTQQDLSFRFQTSSSGSNGRSSVKPMQQAMAPLGIQGSNGTLLITNIHFIVEDLQLEHPDSECEDTVGNDNVDCEEFEIGPFFVDLPLEGGVLDLGTVQVETGLYEELEFEVDNLDNDDEDSTPTEEQDLLNQIQGEYPNWPDEASMVITGSFTPNGGVATNFTTYAKAEVEIELEFDPPLEIDENTLNNFVTVNIDPVSWFLQTDGTVMNLATFDFETSGQILEFEQEIENGFESIESDTDDNDNDNDND